ncbi:MAG: hypothetical protein KKF30_09775 [Proteobacteria bacterium]|nr:hypothetical protein [Pseudomonadota bacterium]MBU4468830.1 hypothetical protein [Pseudomonadota bacterium]MCG2750823.1 hypothetical protein [Desulfobacteraceae bacterium]
MQFIKIMNWRSLMVIALCGLGFYFAFENRIDRTMPDERIEGTGFIVKIMVEELTKEEIKLAMEKTLIEYQARVQGLDIPGATVRQKGSIRILIQIPGIDSVKAAKIKEMLIQPDNIKYKLKVYGPIEE